MNVLAPRLRRDLSANMARRMAELWLETVDAHERRDSDLEENYEQLMRITPPATVRPNRQSCELVDQICFEHFLSLFSTVRAARAQKPYWLFEAFSQEDDEAAQRVEKGLTHRASRDGFDASLYDQDWVSLRDGMAPTYIGWSAKRKNVRSIRFRPVDMDPDDPAFDFPITEEEKEPGVEYDEVPWNDPVPQSPGFDFETYDRRHFYMMAPEANDVDDAMGLGPCKYMTANDLMEAVDRYGFEKSVVEDLIRQGPTGYSDRGYYEEIKAQVSGTDYQNKGQQGIGYWQIAFWFGKFPIWTKNGGWEVPDYIRNDEFLWVMCPRAKEGMQMLRFSYSPFNMRPFTLTRMLREPNGQGGESVPTITGAYQDEGTAILRSGIDSANLRTIPVTKRLASNDERFGTQQISPGSTILCERNLNEIDVMRWDTTAVHETLAWLNDIRTRSKSVMSGAGYGELPQKVRKQAEVEAAVAGVSAKMSLFVANLQASGMERAALIMLSHLGQFAGNEPYSVYQRGSKPIEVQPEDWKRVYSIKPRGTASDADPSVRVQRKQQILGLVRSSPLYQQSVQAGDMRPEYHLVRDVGSASDEQFSIESFFGDEPPGPDYVRVAAQVMGQVYEAMTNLKGSGQQAAAMFAQNPAMQVVLRDLVQAKMQGQQGPPEQGSMMMPPQQGPMMPQVPNEAVAVGRNGAGP